MCCYDTVLLWFNGDLAPQKIGASCASCSAHHVELLVVSQSFVLPTPGFFFHPRCRRWNTVPSITAMAEEEAVYDEIEIEDMEFDTNLEIYHYPCPCGDRFEIGLVDLRDGADIAVCPTCSLQIRVIFEVVRPCRFSYSGVNAY